MDATRIGPQDGDESESIGGSVLVEDGDGVHCEKEKEMKDPNVGVMVINDESERIIHSLPLCVRSDFLFTHRIDSLADNLLSLHNPRPLAVVEKFFKENESRLSELERIYSQYLSRILHTVNDNFERIAGWHDFAHDARQMILLHAQEHGSSMPAPLPPPPPTAPSAPSTPSALATSQSTIEAIGGNGKTSCLSNVLNQESDCVRQERILNSGTELLTDGIIDKLVGNYLDSENKRDSIFLF